MKNIIRLLLLFIFTSNFSNCDAQITEKPSYGISVGGGISNIFTYNNGAIPCYSVGSYRNSRLYDRLFTRSYILLGNRGVNHDFSNVIFNYTYLQLQSGYQIGLLIPRKVKILFGPYLGYNFKQDVYYSINSNIISEYGISGLSDYETKDEFSDYEIGVNLELNVVLSNRASISLNVYQAVSRVYKTSNPYKLLKIENHNYPGLFLTDSEKAGLDKKLKNALNTSIVLSVHFDIM